MIIAFRHVPFTQAQREALTQLATQGGYEALWCEGGELPAPEKLGQIEVLMGYFPPEVIRRMPNLKWVQTPSAGVEKYCADVYANSDVVLTNCSGAFGVAIAEYMIAGLLMLMRNLPQYMANQRERVWKCVGTCRSICGSRIAVIGMGDIGTKFAARVKAMGAQVIGVRKRAQAVPEHFDEVFTSDRLIEAVCDADAVVACLPGTRQTTKLISKEVIEAMPSKAIFVNCGRGYTVDEGALIDALQAKRIGGAVLDVFESEPLDANSPLWDMENVVLTPHISGHDDDPINAEAIYAIFRENLAHWIAGEAPAHVVDREQGY